MVLPVRIIMSPISSSKCLAGMYARSATLRTISSSPPRVVIDGGENFTPCVRHAPPLAEWRTPERPAAGGQHRWYRGPIVWRRRVVPVPRRGARAGACRMVSPVLGAVLVAGAGLLAVGCGAGARQDASEPKATFRMRVVRA